MEELVNRIVEIIGDYRSGSEAEIDRDRVISWVEQFDESDREFLLTELIHILPKSYISEKEARETLGGSFEYLRKKYNQESIDEFLQNSKFLSCQGLHKSQTKLLEFLREYAEEELNFNFDDCGIESEKYWVYLDDVLASGGTFRREIIEKINDYGTERFVEDDIKIISIFFFLHSWGCANSKYVILKDLGKNIASRIDFHRVFEIENDPRINYFNPNPAFNHAFPMDSSESWREFLETLDADRQAQYAFRPPEKPNKESFYSSAENRNRYEQIVLNKGIEIIERIHNVGAPVRPLGFTSPSYKTLGAGSHAFTWRNISNTCPLVYWWESNGWFPLFSVANRGI
ncbi:MAG: hypothetical protein HLUCCA01_10590 [Bacteroidetes bacterium HLUCCA01]|nr:MAG: hypothetical protein HLUCCA01_10590 [Bacteroidetes bacterium HLUCCA01]